MIHPTNFIPKPKKEDYILHDKNFDVLPVFDKTLFDLDLKSWHEVNYEPEYDWVSFDEIEPEINQEFYFYHLGEVHEAKYYIVNSKYQGKKWTDQATHDQKVKEWNERKYKYEGWEIIEDTIQTVMFRKDSAYVTIYKKIDKVRVLSPDGQEYNGSNFREISFEQICKQFGMDHERR